MVDTKTTLSTIIKIVSVDNSSTMTIDPTEQVHSIIAEASDSPDFQSFEEHGIPCYVVGKQFYDKIDNLVFTPRN